MKKNNRYTIVWMMTQIIILIMCIYYLQFFYFKHILPDKEVKHSFQQTTCRVLEKALQKKTGMVDRYRSQFTLRYQVKGAVYQETTSGNGLDTSFAFDHPAAIALFNRFQVNQLYPCWYNPEAPNQVVLALRSSWSTTDFLIIPIIVVVIIIYNLLRSFFEMMRKK